MPCPTLAQERGQKRVFGEDGVPPLPINPEAGDAIRGIAGCTQDRGDRFDACAYAAFCTWSLFPLPSPPLLTTVRPVWLMDPAHGLAQRDERHLNQEARGNRWLAGKPAMKSWGEMPACRGLSGHQGLKKLQLGRMRLAGEDPERPAGAKAEEKRVWCVHASSRGGTETPGHADVDHGHSAPSTHMAGGPWCRQLAVPHHPLPPLHPARDGAPVPTEHTDPRSSAGPLSALSFLPIGSCPLAFPAPLLGEGLDWVAWTVVRGLTQRK